MSPIQTREPTPRRNSVLVLRTLDLLVRSPKDDLDMTGVALVGVDATVRAVGTTASLWRLLNDDVFDEEILERERLCVRVRLGVLEQTKNEFHRFFWPAT